MRKSILVVMMVVCVMAITNIASAEIIRGIDIDFVTIGNAGNAADTTGYGAVDYEYKIGKYEVTNAQWNAFVSAAGAPTGNDHDGWDPYDNSAYHTGAQQPTNGVSWYEAIQFCNYLTSGDKSLGVYQFSGNNINPGDFLGIDRESAASAYGIAYVIPTEDEWYKAAYYSGSGYSTYANGTGVAPTAGVDTNYDWVISAPWNIGSGTEEQNGTFDMMGNVWEWNETFFDSSSRGIRGGSYTDGGDGITLASDYRNREDMYDEGSNAGFRVASVPEPATLLLFASGAVMLRRKR